MASIPHLRSILLAAIAVFGLCGGAVAAQADEGRHGHAAAAAKASEQAGAQFDRRQARIHDLLKLSAAQETAWTTYQAAIGPVASDGERLTREEWAALSAPARLEKAVAQIKLQTAAMEKQLAALTVFYTVLNADQKALFDEFGMRGSGNRRN